jgi:hypothetical protein
MTEFASPATANGIKWADVNGALVMVKVLSIETGIQTAFGASDAVRGDVTVVDGAGRGDDYKDCLIFPKALQSQLRPNVGKTVLGRVTQGAAKPGQSAPWLLAEASDADRKSASEFLAGVAVSANNPPF